jgi:two-component system OmpR family sensor kinase
MIVLLLISAFFSASLYRVSLQQINGSFKRQSEIIVQTPELRYLAGNEKFRGVWKEAYSDATKKLLINLFVMNLFVLAMGGLLSYLFAKRTLEPIEEANESQSRFTADASHELRTPISVMKSEIEVALKDKNLTTKEAREVMNSNLEEIDRLTNMIDALLSLSRLDAEKIETEPVNINKLLLAKSKQLEKLAKEKSITITVDKNVTSAKTNYEYLSQSIGILIDNSIKYCPEGSKIEISSYYDGNKTYIIVSDNGPGIKVSEREKIFNRFYRGDSSRSKHKVDGLGLGLSLAKIIVEKLSGEIYHEDSDRKGATFVIRLPKA